MLDADGLSCTENRIVLDGWIETRVECSPARLP